MLAPPGGLAPPPRQNPVSVTGTDIFRDRFVQKDKLDGKYQMYIMILFN